MLPSEGINTTANTNTESSPTPSAAELAIEVAALKSAVAELRQMVFAVMPPQFVAVFRAQAEQFGAIQGLVATQAVQALAIGRAAETFKKLYDQVVALAKQREMEKAKATDEGPDPGLVTPKEKVN